MYKLHADETDVNDAQKRWWIHVLSSDTKTLMIPHENRGNAGIIETGIQGLSQTI